MPRPSALVVDDEDPVRLLCRVNLEAAGFRVAEAANGPEAIIEASRSAPDLVVLDLMMPGMDGWTVLATIKTAFAHDPPPVIIVSANTTPEIRQRAQEEGATFLAKPFEIDRLVELAQMLARGNPTSPSPRDTPRWSASASSDLRTTRSSRRSR